MTLFWIVTGALALVLCAGLVAALVRGKRGTGPAEAYDIAVYRDQLKEVEGDAARGKIDAVEAERLRVEISRRLLAADAKARGAVQTADQPPLASALAAAAVVLLMIGGGFGLYLGVGQPGYEDLPLQARMDLARETLESRPGQDEVEGRLPASPPVEAPEQYVELVQRLRDTLAERPDDLRGLALLARSEAALGNFRAAYEAQERIVQVKGAEATGQDYADLADMMVLAAGGYVSPEAQAALEHALARDPGNGVARYYGGLLMAQTGRPDIGFDMWNALLRDSRTDDPWVPPITAQIGDLAMLAGETKFQMPDLPGAPPMGAEGATPRGPTAEDMAAAAEMTPEERMDMIRGMVDGLSARLASEGGPAEDWARLIGALGVLGEQEQAGAIWAEAQSVFAGDETALAALRAAAARAGVAE